MIKDSSHFEPGNSDGAKIENAEPERQPEWDVSLPKDQKLDQLINDIAGPDPEVQQAIPAPALDLEPASMYQAAHVPEADKDKPLNAGFGDIHVFAQEEVGQPSLDFKHDEVQEELMMMQPELQAPQAVEGHIE